VHTAPANKSEVTHFDKTLQAANIKASRVVADKAVDKVIAQVLLKGLCMNLLKADNKITLDS
jgi:hypothetical protein